MSEDGFQPFLYRSTRLWMLGLLKLFNRLETRGVEHVPASGGCLLAANHASFVDPPALGCAIPHRVVRFMARDTLFKKGFWGWYIRGLAAVPISRDRGDVGALKRCIQTLRRGDCVGFFPEGTRTRDGQMAPFKGGIGFLIMNAGVPVVPCYIEGSYEALPRGVLLPRPRKIIVHFGRPILPEEYQQFGKGREAYDQIAALVTRRILELKGAA